MRLKNLSSVREVWSLLKRGFRLVLSFIFFFIAWFGHHFTKRPKNLILIGSSYGQGLCDNSNALYQELMLQGYDVFVFIDEEAVCKDLNHQLHHIITRGSFRSFWLYFHARHVCYSHSFSDVLPDMHLFPKLIALVYSPIKIFIQHGVIGLKNLDKYFLKLKPTIDYILVACQHEVDILKNMGFESSQILNFGLPRYDHYQIKTIQSSHEKIPLIFFTWGDEAQYLHDLTVVCERLLQIGICFKIQFHAMQSKTTLPSRLVKFISQESLLSDIQTCDFLITNHSSLMWDFLFLNKDVILYHPASDGYLPLTKTLSDANLNRLGSVEELLNYKVDNQARFFFKDIKNSQRLIDFMKVSF